MEDAAIIWDPFHLKKHTTTGESTMQGSQMGPK